jgi:hypothetical protein
MRGNTLIGKRRSELVTKGSGQNSTSLQSLISGRSGSRQVLLHHCYRLVLKILVESVAATDSPFPAGITGDSLGPKA